MYSVFYQYAGYDKPQIDGHLVAAAHDSWVWFWVAMELTDTLVVTQCVLLVVGDYYHTLLGIVPLFVLRMFYVFPPPEMGPSRAAVEVREILKDNGRRQKVHGVASGYNIDGVCVRSEYAAKVLRATKSLGGVAATRIFSKLHSPGLRMWQTPLCDSCRAFRTLSGCCRFCGIRLERSCSHTRRARSSVRAYAKQYLLNVTVQLPLAETRWCQRTYDWILVINVLSAIPFQAKRIRVLRELSCLLKRRGKLLLITQFRNSLFLAGTLGRITQGNLATGG